MKITVIGAGQGGLRAAAVLACRGMDVTVYEKNSRDALGINWFDGVETKLFTDLDLDVPVDSFKGFPVSFIAPFSEKKLYLRCPEDGMDWSVNRRSFSSQLVKAAEEGGAKIHFDTAVTSLICDKDRVKGVVVDGNEIFSDLVIDSSGVFSKFRASLPTRAHMTPIPEKEDVFNVYRGIYSQTPDFPVLPDDEKFKMHLKYKGKNSISWCGVEPSGELNVLCGMIGELNADDFKELFGSLVSENPIIGELKDGRSAYASIPVRSPLSVFVFPGYTAIGDAAFMTIPIMGNGIANSIRAGQMLADTIIGDDSVSIETLWKYQAEYYRKIGAVCCLLDWCKRGLLACDNSELRRFMESGIVSDGEIYAVTSGRGLWLSPAQWIDKIRKLILSRKLIGPLAGYAAKGLKAMLTALSVPAQYDSIKVMRWQYRIEEAMKRPQ
ncbi:MAG: NAD(P)/FAD-dependent oxidoreductase [Clostridia bacterium]|nr:NAD(P)/FAD-dependent oxidoreductase [Clostridia bacterium]